MKRPQTIGEVAQHAGDARRFWYDVLDFVDELRRLRDPRMLTEEPTLLATRFAGGDVADAYLAAVGVELARELGAVPPAWTRGEARILRRPWFAHEGSALRATLLAESPAGFRERNLFVSANALSRA